MRRVQRITGIEKAARRRSLDTDEKLLELEEELPNIEWIIIVLSEVERTGEACIKIDSGNVLYLI